MAENKRTGAGVLGFLQNNAVAVAAIVAILMLFIPFNHIVIDILMALNLGMAFIVLLQVIFTRTPANFLSFPQVILFLTIFGLGINVASTRIILTESQDSQSTMVQGFANITTGGGEDTKSIIVGVIIFIIIIIFQKVVVTKGAGRVAEVKARFTLDAMNSKQLDINNDVANQTITEEEGKRRKQNLRNEVSFFSAMDGSSKFVSGNVTAGIIITVINLVGGIIMGMVMQKMGFQEALSTYTILTIGDGLMSQLPSILLSFATGILVTGGDEEHLLSEQIISNFGKDGIVYIIAGGVFLAFALAFHNGATVVLLAMGAGLLAMGINMRRRKTREADAAADKEQGKAQGQSGAVAPPEETTVSLLDPLSIELGFAIISLVDRNTNGELLTRVNKIRQQEAMDLGLVVPKVHIQDSIVIDPEEYVIRIQGNLVGRGKLKLGNYMCLDVGTVMPGKEMTGEPTKDPAFGMDAFWIPEEKRTEAEKAGYSVIDPPTILATHLTEIIRRHAAELLGREDVKKLVEKVRDSDPTLVEEVMSGEHRVTYALVEKVLRILLSEQVSIRNMKRILETIGDYAGITRDQYVLAMKVREALGAQITNQLVDENNEMVCLHLSQKAEQKMQEHIINDSNGQPVVAMDAVDTRKFIQNLSDMMVQSRTSILLTTTSEVRQALVNMLANTLKCFVVSMNEAANNREIHVKILGEVDVD